jgi:hypothetical protein
MELNDENYFSIEADKEFMSVSQYKSFLTLYGGCEAKAVAKINGLWKNEESIALLVGSYVHEHFGGTLGKFKVEHPEIFTKQGELKSVFKVANDMVNTLENDKSVMQIMKGSKEKIYTFELFETPWKIKVDVENEKEGYIVDIKTTRDFEKQWIEVNGRNVKVTFVEAWGYLIQATIYKTGISIIKNTSDIDFFIVAVTKQSPPDKVVLYFTEDDFEKTLKEIEINLPHILAVKNGEIEPQRCNKCDYCRSTKKLDQAIHWSEL